RAKLGEKMRYPISSSHFSSKPQADVTLEWRLGGIDTRGRFHRDLARGWAPIPFPHRRVSEPFMVEFEAPKFPVLCTLDLSAYNGEGKVVASNFAQLFVADNYAPEREEIPRALVLRGRPEQWSESQWSHGGASREDQARDDLCFGMGHGFFEWRFSIAKAD